MLHGHLSTLSSWLVTLYLQAKKLESLGFTRQQAEEMTQHLTEQIILDRLRLSERFSAKVELEKVRGAVCRPRCASRLSALSSCGAHSVRCARVTTAAPPPSSHHCATVHVHERRPPGRPPQVTPRLCIALLHCCL